MAERRVSAYWLVTSRPASTGEKGEVMKLRWPWTRPEDVDLAEYHRLLETVAGMEVEQAT